MIHVATHAGTERGTAAAPEPLHHWAATLPHVRKAIKFIRQKGSVTAEQLVEWDAVHGRRLFAWKDPHAAEQYRLHQARLFLNRFRAKFEGMRVRAFIHVREDEQAGIKRDAYFTVEAISQDPGMRAQVIADIARRMTSMASELKMWKLSESERAGLFDRLARAMDA